MNKFKRVIAVILCLVTLCAVFTACEAEIEDARKRDKTIVVDSEVTLYEEPDGRSNVKGTIEASTKVTYSSVETVDGVKWYECKKGWFSIFTPTDHKGHVISSGFAEEELPVFSGAAASAGIVGNVEAGTRLDVYQVRDLWSQTAYGWVLTESIYIPGHTGENAGWCLTLKENVPCYNEPSFDSLKVTEYRSLYRLKLHEILELDGARWGCTDSGWIELTDVYVEGEKGEGACYVQVIDTTPLNVRVGPGTGYDIIRTLDLKSFTDVLFQVSTPNNYWGFVGDGWIYMGLVTVVEE